MNVYNCEFVYMTKGEPDYKRRVRRCTVTMPELTHYGYDGSTNYTSTRKVYERELMRQVKAAFNVVGQKGSKIYNCNTIEFVPSSKQYVIYIALRK